MIRLTRAADLLRLRSNVNADAEKLTMNFYRGLAVGVCLSIPLWFILITALLFINR